MNNYTDRVIIWLLRAMCVMAVAAGWSHPHPFFHWFYMVAGVVGLVALQLLIIAESIYKCVGCGATVPHHEVYRSVDGRPLCRHCYPKSKGLQ